MLLPSLRLSRCASARACFSTRLPGRIFGGYNQGTEVVEEAALDSGAPERMQSRPPSRAESSAAEIAFPEELRQDYSLASFHGASSDPLSPETSAILTEPIADDLIEIKPDGSCYLPEVHYRRILSRSFGISAWSLVPRGPHSLHGTALSREYALFANGRYISQARGHTSVAGAFQSPAMCTEAVRSNALMRCCKDLGIAASLWDNSFVSQWRSRFATRKQVTDHQGRTKMIWEKRRPTRSDE